MSSDPDQPDPGLPAPELLDDEPVRRPRRREERDPEEVSGRRRVRPVRRRWVWCVLALALVAGSVAWYGDQRMRAGETAAVQHCEQRLRTASVLTDIRMGLMVNYVRPRPSTAAFSRHLHLADLMASPARQELPLVERANAMCRAVAVRPWHFSLVGRRNAATAYGGALVTLLRAVASKGSTSFRHDPPFTELRAAAGFD